MVLTKKEKAMLDIRNPEIRDLLKPMLALEYSIDEVIDELLLSNIRLEDITRARIKIKRLFQKYGTKE